MIQKINESKSWFFDSIHNIDKALTRLTHQEKKRKDSNKIRNERGAITTDTKEI